MALTAAGCRENKQRKVYFFTVIRQGYKTLLRKKKNTSLTAARCGENFPNRQVNNFRQKINETHGSCVL